MSTDTRAISKHYLYAGDRRVHYRRAGSGPALVMIHPSPGSSFQLERLMTVLAEQHTCIALDTPGYGESAPLPIDTPTIGDYAEALVGALDALGVARTDLYGSHTGAKIALEFALRQPDRVRKLVIDGVGVYHDDEIADLVANYLPRFPPEHDGSHLVRAWAMRRDMFSFWPWYKRSPEHRLSGYLPSADALHDHVVDMLRAGVDYWKAYHAAFTHDARPGLSRVTVPTLYVTSASDPLVQYRDRVSALAPSVVSEVVAPTEVGARIAAFLGSDDPVAAPPPPQPTPFVGGAIRRDYATTSIGQVLVRKTGVGPKRPLVLFHASPASSKSLEPLALRLGEDRPVITFDNPGQGDSPPARVEGRLPEIWDLVDPLLEIVDQLGWREFDLYGTHTGAMMAMEANLKRPDPIKHLILDGITLFDDAFTADLLQNYPVPLRISSDGGHLLFGWYQLRDMQMWWPWYNRTPQGKLNGAPSDPVAMHDRFLEYIKGGRTYWQPYRAAFAYPTRDKLPLLTAPTLHCASPTDPLREFLAEGVRLTTGAPAQSRVTAGVTTPDGLAATVALFRAFLDDQPLPPGATT
ncbi:MAG: alpha/beta hydrolase [Dehalococcoidia bacterium]|nr:alpha/beta hydrolase [Dehalococcoidia bacterium]